MKANFEISLRYSFFAIAHSKNARPGSAKVSQNQNDKEEEFYTAESRDVKNENGRISDIEVCVKEWINEGFEIKADSFEKDLSCTRG